MVLSNDFVVPPSLLLYEALLPRKKLSSRDQQHYEQLQKGLIGEKKLKSLLKCVNSENIISLFNCLFDIEETEIQIDCILLSADTIFLLEVKNYTGDYFLENDKIYSLQTRKQIRDPLIQLERTDYLFKQLVERLQIDMKVRSYVVFVNEDFMLYNASIQSPIIFPSQIKRFLQKINANAPTLTESTEQLANKLTSMRKMKSDFERLPKYDITELEQGVFCKNCFLKLIRKSAQTFTCPKCSSTIHINDVVLHAISQYHLLFPEEKITTNNISKWCGGAVSTKVIRRVLAENFDMIPNSSHTHYIYKHEAEHLIQLSKNYFNK